MRARVTEEGSNQGERDGRGGWEWEGRNEDDGYVSSEERGVIATTADSG